jgi:Zn-dependent protease with chaperone function
MIKKIFNFFDKLENQIRGRLSKYPIIYAFIGGVGIVLFWRGVWGLSEEIGMTNIQALIISVLILLSVGLFVSFFIGDSFIISSLKGEKKIIEKTKEEILEEEIEIQKVLGKLDSIEQKLDELSENDKT